MKHSLWMGIVLVLVLFLLGAYRVYQSDSATVEQAIIVDKYFKDYCRQHKRYPEIVKVKKRFPELYPNQEWYYWPNKTLTNASFQYPMTLPLPSAPGRSKVSEFFPVIYSYAVQHPCKGLIENASPAK